MRRSATRALADRRQAAGRGRRPRDRLPRHVRAAGLRRPCTAHIGGNGRGRRPSTSTSSGWRTASPPSAIRARGNGLDWMLDQKASAARRTRSPRRASWPTSSSAPAANRGRSPRRRQARGGCAELAARGADGVKFFGSPARTSWRRRSTRRRSTACARACHHAQMDVARMNALDPGALGAHRAWSTGTACPRRCSTDRMVQDLPARLQLQRRVRPLRRGGPAVEAGRAAGLERGTR